MRSLLATLVFCWLLVPPCLVRAEGNRLAYLDETTAHHPSRTFPRLITPQWVGDKGVEAVVILAIDDMRGHDKWERYLRPILDRLKKIDGRAPVSIMTCSLDPKHEHLQRWLQEGVSLETHTIDHPCPLLGKAGLESARSTYERCIDHLASVPNNKPVAFRVPCCDSQNTPSPRFFTQIFNGVSSKGNFLSIDSSVFNVITPDDPELPRELVFDASGAERFRKYLPGKGTFVNTIYDYPYPYVIDRLCLEFPCATPSDWQGQHLRGNAAKATLEDMKAGLDAVVHKKGVYCQVFHPYGWMTNTQVVEFIDHVVAKHGTKVKFLTFREAHDRMLKHLLAGQSLRTREGEDNGVRLLDLDGDGYMDIVIGNPALKRTRRWSTATNAWIETDFPVLLNENKARFGIIHSHARVSLVYNQAPLAPAESWHYDGNTWKRASGPPSSTTARLRDIDGDGICEWLTEQGIYRYSDKASWSKLPFTLPKDTRLADERGRDAGLRLVDVDDDGQLDILFSNEERYSLHLFSDMSQGWAQQILSGVRAEEHEGRKGREDRASIPIISRRGIDNGAWFADRALVVQNETTFALPGLIEKRTFNEMLARTEQGPRRPEASLRSLRARPGFRVEQMAAEPLVRDPIAFAWGPDGKLWVVEMGDYPLGVFDKDSQKGLGKGENKGKSKPTPGGRIVILEDSRGTGTYDKRTVFLDNLSFPTGVLPWRKGVLITCAPNIFYAEDTDGDGKADQQRILFTGFREGNQQHRVNGLVWGLDNRVHVANGDSGGVIRSLKTGKTVNLSGRDLAIDPDTGEMWLQTGQTQFGRSRDDVGNWFGGNNTVPMWHFVLADEYLRRNPYYPALEVRVQVPSIPGAVRVFPRSITQPRFNTPNAANHFTSACSPMVYRDDLFGPMFSRSLFVSEPVHNLVHRQVLSTAGVTFRGERAADEREREFLTSTDAWFRPTMVCTGPDGALWVADMYRQVIEHPEWIPADTQKKLDLRAGHDKGRLYRIYPVHLRPRAIPRLDKLSSAELVAALDSPSGWQRDLAHMMLLWRGDKTELAKKRFDRPLARLHALCALDGLKALTTEQLLEALKDQDPAVRAHAVRLCEGRLASANSTPLVEAFAQTANDKVATVRFQFALSAGYWHSEQAGRLLGRLLREETDRFIVAAAMSSLHRANLDGALLGVLEGGTTKPGLLEMLLLQAEAMKHERALLSLFHRIGEGDGTTKEKNADAWRIEVLAGFLDGLEQRGSSLIVLYKGADADLKSAIAKTKDLFKEARQAVVDEKRPEVERVRGVRLLGRAIEQQKEDRELLVQLLSPRQPEGVQLAAATALGRLDEAELLLRGWKGHSPNLRMRVLDVLLQRRARHSFLIEALEKKSLAPLDFDASRRQLLLTQGNAELRRRAERIFAGAFSDRQKVIDTYAEATKLPGDVVRGKAVFAKSCVACHRLEGVGNDTGPELTPLASKSREYLLTAILDPNRAVETRYLAYIAELSNGRQLNGMLSSSTATSVTIIGVDGKAQTILRRNLERLECSDRSLMPEGLEKDLSVAAMADLLAYLQSRKSEARKPE